MTAMTLIVAGGLLLGSPGTFADLFRPGEHRYREKRFCYRLFVPRPESAKRYPLLVWLHGYGENGLDNERQLKWLDLILDDPDHVEKYRFFILAVQCAPGDPAWYRNSKTATPADMLAAAMDVLHKVMQDYPVDLNRICLAGVSTGGSACWEMAMRYPDVFAAVVPMASWGGDVSRAARLVNIPIWAFHNRDDDTPTPAEVRTTVTAVEKAGGNIHLTLVPAAGHNCWYAAFKVHDAMGWMLAQRRAALICWAPPGTRPWSWWHVLPVPGAMVAIMWLGWRYGRKRRIAR